jgi:hypothetical protein
MLSKRAGGQAAERGVVVDEADQLLALGDPPADALGEQLALGGEVPVQTARSRRQPRRFLDRCHRRGRVAPLPEPPHRHGQDALARRLRIIR